jgi:hypothetical protein
MMLLKITHIIIMGSNWVGGDGITITNNEFIYNGDGKKYSCSLVRCVEAFTFVNDSILK